MTTSFMDLAVIDRQGEILALRTGLEVLTVSGFLVAPVDPEADGPFPSGHVQRHATGSRRTIFEGKLP